MRRYPDEAKTKADGTRIYWVTDREAYLGFGYNTRLVAPAEVPKNFQDLLKPELKGKLAVTTESSTSRVIGTMIKYKGEEFVKRMRAQEMRLFKASSAGFLDLIAAGEVAGSFVVFQNQVTVKKEKKAPVDWVPLDVVPANAGGSAIVANAPHPHAALLFTDFVIGAEGQKLMEQFRYGVAWKDYPFKREYPERGMTSAEYENSEDKWLQLTRSITKRQNYELEYWSGGVIGVLGRVERPITPRTSNTPLLQSLSSSPSVRTVRAETARRVPLETLPSRLSSWLLPTVC